MADADTIKFCRVVALAGCLEICGVRKSLVDATCMLEPFPYATLCLVLTLYQAGCVPDDVSAHFDEFVRNRVMGPYSYRKLVYGHGMMELRNVNFGHRSMDAEDCAALNALNEAMSPRGQYVSDRMDFVCGGCHGACRRPAIEVPQVYAGFCEGMGQLLRAVSRQVCLAAMFAWEIDWYAIAILRRDFPGIVIMGDVLSPVMDAVTFVLELRRRYPWGFRLWLCHTTPCQDHLGEGRGGYWIGRRSRLMYDVYIFACQVNELLRPYDSIVVIGEMVDLEPRSAEHWAHLWGCAVHRVSSRVLGYLERTRCFFVSEDLRGPGEEEVWIWSYKEPVEDLLVFTEDRPWGVSPAFAGAFDSFLQPWQGARSPHTYRFDQWLLRADEAIGDQLVVIDSILKQHGLDCELVDTETRHAFDNDALVALRTAWECDARLRSRIGLLSVDERDRLLGLPYGASYVDCPRVASMSMSEVNAMRYSRQGEAVDLHVLRGIVASCRQAHGRWGVVQRLDVCLSRLGSVLEYASSVGVSDDVVRECMQHLRSRTSGRIDSWVR